MNSPGQDSSDLKESNTPPDSESKRRKPATNGRGVNTLSKEALDKKRDNDRKAQAAIRRRQKEEVATLRARIEELSAQKPFQELKSAIEEKNAIHREYNKLREVMLNFVENIRPLLNPGIQELALEAHRNAQAALATSLASDSNFHQPRIDQATYATATAYPTVSNESDSTSPSMPHRDSALTEQRELVQRHHQLNKDESLDFGFLFQNPESSGRPTGQPRARQSLSISSIPPQHMPSGHESQHVWSRPPLNSSPDTALDRLLIDFVKSHQQPATSPRSATYPTNPSILHLLNPLDSTASSGSASPDLSRHMRESMTNIPPTPDTLSIYMARLVTWFDGLSGLPEKVAVCYVMYGMLRWQTYPTLENYQLMPEWMRPCPSQLNVYHPAWFDHIPFPEMRDRMLRGSQDRYRFGETWFESWTEGLSVNWPFSDSTCLANTGKDGQEEISPVFLEHITKLDSWSLSSRFFDNFPELRGTAPIRDKIRHPMTSYTSNGQIPRDTRQSEMDAAYPPSHGQYSYDHRRPGNGGRRDTGG